MFSSVSQLFLLGAEILIKTYISSLISTFSMTHRPKGSRNLEWIVQSTPFLTRVATPHELELPYEP